MPKVASGFRTDINGLRALAVICVVLFHLGVTGFDGGFVGVDVFFVISGFLMTGAIYGKLVKEKFSLIDFYWARARRIIPAQLAVLTVLAGVCWFILLPSDYVALGEAIVAAAAFVANIALWRQQGYFDESAANKWLLHTWSLSVEWQFYLLYPLVLLVLWRWGRNSARFIKAGLIVFALGSLSLSIFVTPLKPEAAFFLLPTRAWEMLAGGFAYLYRDKLRFNAGVGTVLGAVGLLLIAACTFFYSEQMEYPGGFALVPVLGTLLIVIAERQWPVWSWKPVAWLGNTSYSLYLWHWPMIVGVRYYEIELSLPVQLALGGTSLVAAWLSYHFVEEAFRRSGHGQSGKFLLRWSAISLGVAALGGGVVMAKGFAQRLPPLAAANDAARSGDTYPEGCGFEEPDVCALGEPRTEKIFFLGDSHLAHLHAPISQMQAPVGNAQVLIMLEHGCIPLRGVDTLPADGSCFEFTDRALERARQKDVQTVVWASIWAPYFDENPCQQAAEGCVAFSTKQQAIDRAKESLVKDVTELVRLGKRVFIVADVPVYQQNIAKVLARASWLGESVQTGKTLAEHRQYTTASGQLLQAAKRVGATILDPADVFCAGGQCEARNEQGVSYYSDNNHLTPAAALRLVPLLKPVFH